MAHPLSIPPAHTVDPDDVDEDTHPTGAWSIGEVIDPAVAEQLRAIARQADQ